MRIIPIGGEVPQVVTMRQARVALENNDLLDGINTHLNNKQGKEGKLVRIEWEYAQEVRRDSVLVQQIKNELGWSDDQLDALFKQASQIE